MVERRTSHRRRLVAPMTRISLLRTPAAEALDRIREVRTAGDVPLVGDERWPQDHWDTVRALVRDAHLPAGTGWATLTSGSSGLPRVVVRTDESWNSSFGTLSEILGVGPEDAMALPAPPSSSLTLFSLAHALAGGPRPLPGRGGEAATCFHGTPQGLAALLDADAPTSVRTALVGGSHLDPRLRQAAESRGIRVVAYYGAAELSLVAIDEGAGLRAFPGVDLEVRDGQLWVRSPYTALGYLGHPGPLRRDGDWATVGDLAELSGDVLRLRGRSDGAILTASATVIPEEVEVALRLLPGVADAIIFGLPTPRIGALVAAYIEPESDLIDAATLRRAAWQALAPASRPRAWFAGELPRTPAGKPARAEALRLALAGEVPRLG